MTAMGWPVRLARLSSRASDSSRYLRLCRPVTTSRIACSCSSRLACISSCSARIRFLISRSKAIRATSSLASHSAGRRISLTIGCTSKSSAPGSGPSERASVSASWPLDASCTRWPRSRRSEAVKRRLIAPSSTIRMLAIGSSRLRRCCFGLQPGERRAFVAEIPHVDSLPLPQLLDVLVGVSKLLGIGDQRDLVRRIGADLLEVREEPRALHGKHRAGGAHADQDPRAPMLPRRGGDKVKELPRLLHRFPVEQVRLQVIHFDSDPVQHSAN